MNKTGGLSKRGHAPPALFSVTRTVQGTSTTTTCCRVRLQRRAYDQGHILVFVYLIDCSSRKRQARFFFLSLLFIMICGAFRIVGFVGLPPISFHALSFLSNSASMHLPWHSTAWPCHCLYPRLLPKSFVIGYSDLSYRNVTTITNVSSARLISRPISIPMRRQLHVPVHIDSMDPVENKPLETALEFEGCLFYLGYSVRANPTISFRSINQT